MKNPSPFASCQRFLNGHGPRRPAEALRRALAQATEDDRADIYGCGAIIEDFERDIAKRLGFESAVFMPSGTMAQQIALRIACDRADDNHRVAMHATSHLQLHEEDAMRLLHHLEPQLLADATRMMTLSDLQALGELPAAILWELPQREIGGQLPSWEALNEEVRWARARGIHCHLDGARLWESTPFYARSHAEIASLFDSAYVSFYKGLGGIAGAVLAGTKDFIAESRPWLRRHGGNLISLYPYVLSAKDGLERHLGHFGDYVARARALASELGTIDGITVVPEVPTTPMMHLHIDVPANVLNTRNEELARSEQVLLFGTARPLEGTRSIVELSIGRACRSFDDAEVRKYFERLVRP